jgi:hypothetical protein
MQASSSHVGPLFAGRRARQLVPALATQAVAMGLAQATPSFPDDLKLFSMTLAGGLVFFGTFFS